MRKTWMVIALIVMAMAALGAASGAMVTAAPAAGAVMAPADVTSTYYTWYLDLLDAEVLVNPLLDGLYRISPYLGEALSADLDAQVAAAQGVGLPVDPFLCTAQGDVPLRISVRSVGATDAGTARVFVRGSFPTESGLTETRPLATVTLAQDGGQWMLSGVACR